MTRLFLFISMILFSSTIYGQYDREDIFVDQNGNELLQSLIVNYKPSSTLDYGEARDILFGEIDIVNDSLTCVYTGLQIYLDPALDPTVTAFDQNINTEHTFPRSKGADEFTLGYTDMHHLYPTRVDANSARGSLPLQEIVDNQADEWFRETSTLSSIPNSNIDEYSEYRQNIAFEPREDHKGDVARSYFYFYTMYKNNADNADPDFFELQREDMCSWHDLDPVDKKEWNRTKNIAAVQGNQNPFVLDCRLARLYCSEISNACQTVGIEEETLEDKIQFSNEGGLLHISGETLAATLRVINSMGSVISHLDLNATNSLVDLRFLSTGVYFINITSQSGEQYTYKIVR